jgi:multiple sugar transport system permease protein
LAIEMRAARLLILTDVPGVAVDFGKPSERFLQRLTLTEFEGLLVREAFSAGKVPALAVVDTWQWTPLITLITLAGLATLPLEPYESALIDGASGAQMFWRITLPLLRPTIIVALLFRAIDCLKTFDIIYVMTQGGPGFASETLNVYTFQVGLFYFHIGYASSLLVILFALVLGVSLLLIKVRRGSW